MKDSILISIVNYGKEQLDYLQRVINELKLFKKYDVDIIVTTNVRLESRIQGVEHFNLIEDLSDWQLLPLMARRILKEEIGKYDYYIFTENDHLWKEHHIDKYIQYESILPNDYISGLVQYEIGRGEFHYPAFHLHWDWDYNSVEEHGGLKFAYLNNVHQASFLISENKFQDVNKNFDLDSLWSTNDRYSPKCKVNTEIYESSLYKKVICISEFYDNLIHHLPNIYVDGTKGRAKLGISNTEMKIKIKKLLQ